MDELNKKLGYSFRDPNLLQLALRHRSLGKSSNERLEFLGDALLNFIIGAELFQLYPHLNEGELSRLRANLVNGEVLATLARELAINTYLQVGLGEVKVMRRDSMLADMLEAIIGAIYLDSDIITCNKIVLGWFQERLTAVTSSIQKDAKSRLQELLQARGLPLPRYRVLHINGVAHNQVFSVACEVPGLRLVTKGVGASKRKAEQEAAAKFLKVGTNDE